MPLKYYAPLKKYGRILRKNMTDSERLLWGHLRGKQINNLQFYRQRPLGKYIVDFYCPAAKLVIEIDGSQHMDESAKRKDEERDKYLKKIGLNILRFNNLDVFENVEGVIEMIHIELEHRKE